MPKFKFQDTSAIMELKFHFLISEYGFECLKKEQTNIGFHLEYGKGNRRVLLYYDYRDNFFYFSLIRGMDTPYPNDQDDKNIIPFYRIAPPGFDADKLQPDEEQYQEALNANVRLLREHGPDILKGKSWPD